MRRVWHSMVNNHMFQRLNIFVLRIPIFNLRTPFMMKINNSQTYNRIFSFKETFIILLYSLPQQQSFIFQFSIKIEYLTIFAFRCNIFIRLSFSLNHHIKFIKQETWNMMIRIIFIIVFVNMCIFYIDLLLLKYCEGLAKF